jgi:hypothetical protein
MASALRLDRQHDEQVVLAASERRLASGAKAAGLTVFGAES